LGDVSTCLRIFSDKRRTVTDFVHLIRNQEVCLNPLTYSYFFSAVRELSVSSEQGDGNGKEFKMPFMWA
jgi:hypothetical protein